MVEAVVEEEPDSSDGAPVGREADSEEGSDGDWAAARRFCMSWRQVRKWSTQASTVKRYSPGEWTAKEPLQRSLS